MKKLFYIFITLGLLLVSCEKFLEEENRSNELANNYYTTADGFQSLVYANYAQLREIYGQAPDLFCAGTDLYSGGRGYSDNGLNDYGTLNPESEHVELLYNECYVAIQNANKALYYADLTEDTGELLVQQVGEVRFIRALSYFLLVQTYGGVPLVTDYFTSLVKEFSRASTQEIYNFILEDLNQALTSVSEKDYDGHVNQRAVKNLLGLVYLTRPTADAGGSNSDYATAATLFDEVIDGQTLDIDFESLWYPGNEMNEEVIFSVQFSAESQSADPNNLGNLQYNLFGPYMGGSENYHSYPSRDYDLIATKFAIDLFEENDERYHATFMVEILEDTNHSKGGGYFDYYRHPKSEHGTLDRYFFYVPRWVDNDSLTRYKARYPNTNIREYGQYHATGVESDYLDFYSIACKKFDDPDNSIGGRTSTRDIILFRLADTYLMAAEAQLKTNGAAAALPYVNEVRSRANATPAVVDDIDIDYILDERGRELFGEYHRWFDLKRTEKLVERASLHNFMVEEANFSGTGGNLKILRPIPQDAIDLNQNLNFVQNPAY